MGGSGPELRRSQWEEIAMWRVQVKTNRGQDAIADGATVNVRMQAKLMR